MRGSGEPRGGGADPMSVRPAPPIPLPWGEEVFPEGQEPDVDPLLEPAGGAEPVPDGGVLEGAPECVPEPVPILGQFLVEPELELVPEPVELEDPEPVVPVPELPVLELDEGVVVDEPDVAEFDVALVPELPVVVDVVAALATSAPPARRPELSAPTARMLRRRIFIACVPFVSSVTPTRSGR